MKKNELKVIENATTDKTPIEVLLQVDDDGTVSAKKVYEFLEFDPTHYKRWCNENILNNPYAEKDKDFEVFAIKGENPKGGRPTTDYKLTVSFAKKLCMVQKNERGEQARDFAIQSFSALCEEHDISSTEIMKRAKMIK